jgi:K+-transporting ATPase A subunit
MIRTQFSIHHIMIVIAAIGVLLGAMVWARAYDLGTLLDGLLRTTVLFLLPAIFIVAVFFMVRVVCHQPLRTRLVTEFATLLLLLGFSSIIWRPSFYAHVRNTAKLGLK